MPARILPTFTRAEVEAHNTEGSCYVTIGDKVYDITDFVQDHPGGPEFVLEYAGKDVEEILKDEVSHTHSDSAYEILDESLVGFVVNEKSVNGSATKTNGVATGSETKDGKAEWVHPRTGMSREEDLSKDTDYNSDYKTHKFLDLSRPLFPQIWFGGFDKDFYLDQVHRPRHYKGGASAPLFGNFLEPLSKTPWWVIPTIWLPPVIYGTILSREGLNSPLDVAMHFIGGFFLWSLLEYVLHRFLFHLDEEEGEDWAKELEDDVRQEAESKYGRVVHISVDPNSKGDIYLKFDKVQGGENAIKGLNGRYFGGRMIDASPVVDAVYSTFGVFLFAGGLTVFLLPFTLARSAPNGWSTDYIIAMIVVGFVTLVGFALYQVYLAPVPFLKHKFLTDRTVLGACLIDFTYQMSYSSWNSYFTSFLQVVNNVTVAEAGYVNSTFQVVSGVLLFIVGYLIRRKGRFRWLFFVAVPFYVLGLGLMIHFRRPNGEIGYIVMCQIFTSIGGAIFILGMQIAVLAAVDHQHVAAALAMLFVSGGMGGAVGSTISGAIWTNTFLPALRRYLPEGVDALVVYGDIVAQLSYPVGSPERLAIQQAYGYAQTRMLAADGHCGNFVVGYPGISATLAQLSSARDVTARVPLVICPMDQQGCKEEMDAIEQAAKDASHVDPNNPMLPARSIILANDREALHTLGLCIVGGQKKPLIDPQTLRRKMGLRSRSFASHTPAVRLVGYEEMPVERHAKLYAWGEERKFVACEPGH
ncbi:Siderophore iron transporter mirB like protein [Verticillium longisporum]|uniref:Siderophore iron transporter mirB like protein n=1 Tax=Verticillium longisporum TaxID=100787 RepID=A0A8I3ASX5_VERLO|nr:Siderophore iron transporter mirB like protein [Verticillium longisporum]